MDDQYTFNTHFNSLWQKNKETSRTHHGAYSCAKYGDLHSCGCLFAQEPTFLTLQDAL